MATRQYVGARYVPKVFEYNGSSNWVSGIAYEPLTIVTYLNNSFTSKKPVPSSVGSPNLNPEYWANTGDYSGTVSQLTELVNGLSESIDSLSGTVDGLNDDIEAVETEVNSIKAQDKKFWLISDSFLRYTENWGTPFDTWTGQTSHKTYEGGAGFNKAGNQTGSTIVQIIQNDNNVPNDITDVVLYAGANDCDNDNYNVTTAFHNAINAIKVKAPNAQIWVSFNGTYWTDYQKHDYVGSVYTRIMMSCAEHKNCCFVKSPWYGIQNKVYATDYVHPNQAGYNKIAKCFINKIYKGSDTNEVKYNLVSGITFETCDSEYITIKAVELNTLYDGDAVNLITSTAVDLTDTYAIPTIPLVNYEWGFYVWCRTIDSSNTTKGTFIYLDFTRDGKIRMRSMTENLSNIVRIEIVATNSITVPMIRNLHAM